MKLIIVESPGKIKTIQKFLGGDFTILASNGHIMNLPDKKLGVNIEDGFTPEYVVISGRKKIIQELKKANSSSDTVYLAPDPDREGEAIAGNLASVLHINPKSDCRIVFQEITEQAVKAALSSPRPLNLNKIEAQKSRRVLDRLAGYLISPLLWKKIGKGLSAGRVQSAALYMLCLREGEIESFNSEKFFKIFADYSDGNYSFTAEVTTRNNEKIRLEDPLEVQRIVSGLSEKSQTVSGLETKKKKENPPAPFITSTLQQEANQRFGFSASRTMKIAQKLYEGIDLGKEGPVALITYMRTDSTRISDEARTKAAEFISRQFGKEYLGSNPVKKKAGKFTQDAHEAVRPTYIEKTPDSVQAFLSPEEFKLFNLIWQRFIASQMASRDFEELILSLKLDEYTLESKATRTLFPGFRAVSGSDQETQKNTFGSLSGGESLKPTEVRCDEKETQPPPRYNEASLIRSLEKEGIGRPSTYALILKTLLDRKYVVKNEKKFFPTDLGIIVNDVLKKFFSELIDVKFTAQMEEQLDKIELGESPGADMLSGFYQALLKDIEIAGSKLAKISIKVTETCPECGKPLEIKYGKNGRFIACTGYPACKLTRPLPDDIRLLTTTLETENTQISVAEHLAPRTTTPSEPIGSCPTCGGNLVQKRGRFGEFIACSNYPDCKYTRKDKVVINCPVAGCTGTLIRRRGKKGRFFYGCSRYPDCTFTSSTKPEPQNCASCDAPMKFDGKKWFCPTCDGNN
ncbi:MAG: type I DNA topoisomerase [Candidatus Wallbacteria bacterium]|nr:type I DNA topoisomerase [Candidatus Wallbacteria bacterium]